MRQTITEGVHDRLGTCVWAARPIALVICGIAKLAVGVPVPILNGKFRIISIRQGAKAGAEHEPDHSRRVMHRYFVGRIVVDRRAERTYRPDFLNAVCWRGINIDGDKRARH